MNIHKWNCYQTSGCHVSRQWHKIYNSLNTIALRAILKFLPDFVTKSLLPLQKYLWEVNENIFNSRTQKFTAKELSLWKRLWKLCRRRLSFSIRLLPFFLYSAIFSFFFSFQNFPHFVFFTYSHFWTYTYFFRLLLVLVRAHDLHDIGPALTDLRMLHLFQNPRAACLNSRLEICQQYD